MGNRTKIFFDGGCRPRGMTIAVVLRGEVFIRHDPGPGDSMDAEWLALIAAVRLARRLDLRNVVFLGDSRAVVGQATGVAKVRGAGLRHGATFADLIAPGIQPHIRYIKRSQNLAGIALDRHHDGVLLRSLSVLPA